MRRLSEVALAILALAATGLVVGFGVSDTKQRSLASEASSWRGLVGGGHPDGLGRPARAGRAALALDGAARRAERRRGQRAQGADVDAHRPRRPAAAARGAEHARDPAAGPVQLLARPERLLGAARRERDRRARAPARGGRRLPGAAGLPGLRLLEPARREGRRARGEQPARAAAARLRRARRDDRAARHRRRPRAPVPERPHPAGDRPRRRRRRHERRARPGRLEPARAARDRDGRDPRRRRRPRRGRRDRAGRLGAADPRRGLAAGRHRRLRPSTRAPTS